MTLCVISDWLYQWLIYTAKCATDVCVCVLWILLICNLSQNRSLRCSCPWDRHVRRLSVRDDPKSHFKEDCTIFFIRICQSRFFLVDLFSEKHLSVAYFVSKCKLFDKDESDFYHKDLIRKQNLALSWFKPASTLSSKYECWCEFEKDLKLLSVSKI